MRITTTLIVEIQDGEGDIFARAKEFTEEELDYGNCSIGSILAQAHAKIKAEINAHITKGKGGKPRPSADEAKKEDKGDKI